MPLCSRVCVGPERVFGEAQNTFFSCFFLLRVALTGWYKLFIFIYVVDGAAAAASCRILLLLFDLASATAHTTLDSLLDY